MTPEEKLKRIKETIKYWSLRTPCKGDHEFVFDTYDDAFDHGEEHGFDKSASIINQIIEEK